MKQERRLQLLKTKGQRTLQLPSQTWLAWFGSWFVDRERWSSSAFCFHSELVKSHGAYAVASYKNRAVQCSFPPTAVHALASQWSVEVRFQVPWKRIVQFCVPLSIRVTQRGCKVALQLWTGRSEHDTLLVSCRDFPSPWCMWKEAVWEWVQWFIFYHLGW